jgi:hypothetical protein
MKKQSLPAKYVLVMDEPLTFTSNNDLVRYIEHNFLPEEVEDLIIYEVKDRVKFKWELKETK